MPTSIVWFRNDLRLADNPALMAGTRRGSIVPVYVLGQETEGLHARGGASRWWLHRSLTALDLSLRQCGSRLVVRRGKADRVRMIVASFLTKDLLIDWRAGECWLWGMLSMPIRRTIL